MKKTEELQNMIRFYKDETGNSVVDMKEVADFAFKLGYEKPKPQEPRDILASKLSRAARQETKYDKETGRPYRVNHAIQHKQGNETLHLWIDIDDPSVTRHQMHQSLTLRREQMVSDGLQLSYDAEHWNDSHKNEKPIQLEMDLTFDISLRKHSDDREKSNQAA